MLLSCVLGALIPVLADRARDVPQESLSELLWPLQEGAVVEETFICTCQNSFVEKYLEQGAFHIFALNILCA